jgi:hypothetical protein
MNYNLTNYQSIQLSNIAIHRYALADMFDMNLTDDYEKRFTWAQIVADQINRKRKQPPDTAQSAHETMAAAAHIHALTLLKEAYLRLIFHYCKHTNIDITTEISEKIQSVMKAGSHERICVDFLTSFPSREIYNNIVSPDRYLTDGAADRQGHLLMAMLTSRLHEINPAAKPYSELITTPAIQNNPLWKTWAESVEHILNTLSGFGGERYSLMEMLKQPMTEAPESLTEQLAVIAVRWRFALGDFSNTLLRGADMIREAEKPPFGGSGPADVPHYDVNECEFEAYSEDIDWMPNCVLLAKSTYVWMEQLEREYGVPVNTLSDIPDAALKQIADRGFNGLWLIGLWKRSPASRSIKRLCGNPEAEASAYAIYDYVISDELGGDDAFESLKRRAKRYGIRMAGDMVPNHMGIDSQWVCRYPERFVSTDESPFVNYTFNGADVSPDSNCSIYLEDHYYSRDDAAVVFKHVSHHSGAVRYIYHGNDGTGLPWNDTAQLNYLDETVRKEVSNTILAVAKKFPIIRFDAAMTLTKKHFHRLWYPEPGSGGDIASRSRFGMAKQDFDRIMPTEFWRDVVERVAAEAPGTLLLAEAFWLMEGYFVRTLGMHRVYNSAFMNMLAAEDNQKYRDVIKNTISFDPEILKRYVNFMNNPDEKPAVIQFGKGDKYFGVCVMLSTLPGLPMFGHGQFEGFEEKYGMEYRRSYWSESPDQGLVAWHEQIITPLLEKRRLFAGVDNFRLYDFVTHDHGVDENVFAYTNYDHNEGALVVYNNASGQTSGVLRMSVPWKDRQQDALRRETPAQALRIPDNPDVFVLMFDVICRKWFIKNGRDIHYNGFRFDLNGYQARVFINIHCVQDTPDNRYRFLEEHLSGQGSVDLAGDLADSAHQEFLNAIKPLFAPNVADPVKKFLDDSNNEEDAASPIDFDDFRQCLAKEIPESVADCFTFLTHDRLIDVILDTVEVSLLPLLEYRQSFSGQDRLMIAWHAVIIQTLKHSRHQITDSGGVNRLHRLLRNELTRHGIALENAATIAGVIDRLTDISLQKKSPDMISFFNEPLIRDWIQVHSWRDALYFNRESFEEFLLWCRIVNVLTCEQTANLATIAGRSEYRYKDFLDAFDMET